MNIYDYAGSWIRNIVEYPDRNIVRCRSFYGIISTQWILKIMKYRIMKGYILLYIFKVVANMDTYDRSCAV